MQQKMRNRHGGFTLVELTVYLLVFSFVIMAFISIFVVLFRMESNQSSVGEVETQSQFLLQQVQYYVEQSSLVDMPQDTASTTLTLRMANPALDPTIINAASGVLYLKQGSGLPVALSSNKVSVVNVAFTKRSNPPGHDAVSVNMTVSFNTANVGSAFSQCLQTSIARVSASTFDSNLIPSTTQAWSIGVTGNTWTSINNIINFSGTNVGIDTTSSPAQALEVNGGVRLNTYTTQPSCSAAANTEGTLWFIQNGGTATDTLQLCVQGNGGTYQWVRIY